MLWLAFLHHRVTCYTCLKPLDRKKLTGHHGGHQMQAFAEGHHVRNPPDYSGYSSKHRRGTSEAAGDLETGTLQEARAPPRAASSR
jgi:hypothetical protein